MPCSATTPSTITKMAFALRTVLRRWATSSMPPRGDRRCRCSSSAPCTMASLALSSALVASSRRSRQGARTTARAMATRCFWPPLRRTPRSPTSVSMPFGSWASTVASCAMVTASSRRDAESLGALYRMFSRMDTANRGGSCVTGVITVRMYLGSSVAVSSPSRSTRPPAGSYRRSASARRVLLPHPLLPTMATRAPAGTGMVTPLSTEGRPAKP